MRLRLTEIRRDTYQDESGQIWTAFNRHHQVLCRGCKQYTLHGLYRDSPAEYTVRCWECVKVGYAIVDESDQDGCCEPSIDEWVSNRLADEYDPYQVILPADVRRIVAQVADMLDAGYLHSDHVSASGVRSHLAVAV